MLRWRASMAWPGQCDVMLVGVACTKCSAITPEHNELSRCYTPVSTPGAGTTLCRRAEIEASPRISGSSGGRLVLFKRRHTSGLGLGSVGWASNVCLCSALNQMRCRHATTLTRFRDVKYPANPRLPLRKWYCIAKRRYNSIRKVPREAKTLDTGGRYAARSAIRSPLFNLIVTTLQPRGVYIRSSHGPGRTLRFGRCTPRPRQGTEVASICPTWL